MNPFTTEQGNGRRIFRLLPIAMLGAFIAGYVETSSISLFAVYVTGFGHDAVIATLLVSAFGLGGTLLQVPVGWAWPQDRAAPRAPALCAAIILAGSVMHPAVIGAALAGGGHAVPAGEAPSAG